MGRVATDDVHGAGQRGGGRVAGDSGHLHAFLVK